MTTRSLGPIVALSLVVLGLSSDRVFAQEDETARRAAVVDIPLIERSRIFKNIPDKDTGELFEAWLGVNFLFHGNMQQSYDDAKLNNNTHDWENLLSFTMAVNLRQMRLKSAPVVTPSYMPRFRFTRVWTERPAAGPTTGQFVSDFTVGHYSNGQAGCTFQQQDPDADCQFRAPTPADQLTANGKDGSFSTHYLEGAVAYRWIYWDNSFAGGGTRVPSKNIFAAYLRVRDYKLLSGVPGGMDEDLRPLYGTLRARVGVDVVNELGIGPLWYGGWLEYSNGDAELVGRYRGAIEIGQTFDWAHGLGVFARYYQGHDDYNIAFLQPLKVFHLGFSLGGERRPTFNR
jgi:hypothetical protein